MHENKQLLFISLFFLAAVFLRCTPIHNHQTFEKNHSLNYQKDSFHPKRTVAYLKPILDSLTINIITVLNDSTVRPRVRGRSMSFNVLPSGRIKHSGFWDFPKPDPKDQKDNKQILIYYQQDTILNNIIDSVAMKYKADSIPDYKPYLRLFGYITEVSSSLTFSFKDSALYVNSLTGGRSKASIMKVVMAELPKLKYAYNQYLRQIHGLQGKIIIKFAIDEFGKVIYSKPIPSDSPVGNEDLEADFAEIVSKWRFEKINKPGDVTEVVYPFILSQ